MKILGILNVTPDSFYDGGKYLKIEDALSQAEKLISEGADIIDIGGESTRPGSQPVSVEEEIKRVVPVIKEIKKRWSQVPLSIDSYKYEVIKQALENGVEIINDIYALRYSPEVINLLKIYPDVKIILMHMQGTPQTMQINPYYPKGVISDIKEFFIERIKFLIENKIDLKRIILDPGIGFGKTTQHNIEILKNLKEFKKLTIDGEVFTFEVLVGLSRKSFIGRILGSEENPLPPQERYEGSIVLHTYCILQGVDYLRVHDVKATKQALKLLSRIME
ncbi:MAG: dihydropteroate synthase [Elusimicrobiota bacterium]|nr:dihydropteroate synthase [Endomicrobiia bacterium]MDW8165697.1 dihydropteroate synthase [Elusimicrobiota bacterium]